MKGMSTLAKTLGFGVLVLFLAGLCGCEKQPKEAGQPNYVKKTAVWHADRLRAGDFRIGPGRSVSHGEPYHLGALIEMGREAGPALQELLADDSGTPYDYMGSLTFLSSSWRPANLELHVATIGDMADYALRVIYRTDVGYRSHLSEEQRRGAIGRWHGVIQGRSGACTEDENDRESSLEERASRAKYTAIGVSTT